MYQQEYPGHVNPQQMSNFCPTSVDQLHNSDLPLSAGQLPNGHVNPNGIEYEHQSLMFGETTYEQITTNQPQNLPLQSFTPDIEQSNQNDAEYGLDGGDDNQQQNDQPNDINIEDTAWMDSDQPDVKEEFDDTNNQLITTTDQISQNRSPLSAPASNDQSNRDLIKCDDEDDCDCDDCLNGIEVKYEYDDDDVQIIEDNDDESSRPRKIPRLDTTEPKHEQPLVTRQSSILTNRNQTDQAQSNDEQQIEDQADETNEVEPNQDKQFLTLSVQCPQTDCALMFPNKLQLNTHMRIQHDILPYRCLLKDCNQSFSTKHHLSDTTSKFTRTPPNGIVINVPNISPYLHHYPVTTFNIISSASTNALYSPTVHLREHTNNKWSIIMFNNTNKPTSCVTILVVVVDSN